MNTVVGVGAGADVGVGETCGAVDGGVCGAGDGDAPTGGAGVGTALVGAAGDAVDVGGGAPAGAENTRCVGAWVPGAGATVAVGRAGTGGTGGLCPLRVLGFGPAAVTPGPDGLRATVPVVVAAADVVAAAVVVVAAVPIDATIERNPAALRPATRIRVAPAGWRRRGPVAGGASGDLARRAASRARRSSRSAVDSVMRRPPRFAPALYRTARASGSGPSCFPPLGRLCRTRHRHSGRPFSRRAMELLSRRIAPLSPCDAPR